MARLPEPTKGTVLDQDYARHGFPLRTGPPYVALILASDPWEYLYYHLRDTLTDTRARPSLAFLEQARDFFDAAQSHRVSSRPLLYYYSFLNLAKVLLLARRRRLSDTPMHGLAMVKAGSRGGRRFDFQRVRVRKGAPGEEVFPELVQALGGSVTDGQKFKVVQLLQQIVGIHSTWAEVAGKCSCFASARIEPVVRSDHAAVFSRVLVRKPWDNPGVWKLICKRAHWSQVRLPERHRIGASGAADLVCLETSPVPRKGVSYRSALADLAHGIRAIGVHALLTRQGYRLYLSDFGQAEKARLPQAASIYAAMFYLGAITRYQPQDFDTIVSGSWAWLVSDFLSSQPKQFLYLMAGEITGNDVVVPFGQLD